MKKHGHYCKICGEYKANEKFSGKGHAAHICKACSTLPPEKKAEMLAINRLLNLPWQLSKEQKDWLRRRTHDRRTEVKALAQQQYEVRFGYAHTCDELDDAEEIELPSPFARRFGIISPSFVTVHNTAKDREKLPDSHSIIRKLSILGYRLSLFKAYQYLRCYGGFSFVVAAQNVMISYQSASANRCDTGLCGDFS